MQELGDTNDVLSFLATGSMAIQVPKLDPYEIGGGMMFDASTICNLLSDVLDQAICECSDLKLDL